MFRNGEVVGVERVVNNGDSTVRQNPSSRLCDSAGLPAIRRSNLMVCEYKRECGESIRNKEAAGLEAHPLRGFLLYLPVSAYQIQLRTASVTRYFSPLTHSHKYFSCPH